MRVFLLGALLSAQTLAVPDQCIQAPQRSQPCPHLIYKMARLDKDQPRQLLCVCLSDFKPLLQEPQTASERTARQMELRRLSAELGIEESLLLEIVRY
ncbi:hypothetical protein [Bowmanella dokdonensis]|uniref:Uncharacterized protein n=1 Tax=Bowmanella dokdonensis TaxID=751969 RepID=A0A939DNY3_9ALTE|nr:hypothetical protein [Bowmanella dokdonensis]MBN7826085.1 hypothetical protein [Bowmanella dokdonensis]